MTKREYAKLLKDFYDNARDLSTECGAIPGTEFGGDFDEALSTIIMEIEAVAGKNGIELF